MDALARVEVRMVALPAILQAGEDNFFVNLNLSFYILQYAFCLLKIFQKIELFFDQLTNIDENLKKKDEQKKTIEYQQKVSGLKKPPPDSKDWKKNYDLHQRHISNNIDKKEHNLNYTH